MYSTLVKNGICRGSNGFSCTFCKSETTSKQDILIHISNEEHLKHISKTNSIKYFKVDEKQCFDLVQNGIIRVGRDYKCTICCCDFSKNLDIVIEHISGKKHTGRCKRVITDYDIYKLDKNQVNPCSKDHLEKDCEKIFSSNIILDNQENEVNIIPTVIPNRSIDNTVIEIEEKLEKVLSSNSIAEGKTEENVPNVSIKNENKETTVFKKEYCLNDLACKQFESNKELNSNNNQNLDEHKNFCDNNITKTSVIRCNGCQGNLDSDAAVLYHRMFHLSQKSYDIIMFAIKENRKNIYCMICDHIMNNENQLQKHLTDISHEKRLLVLCCPNNSTIMNMIQWNSALYPNIPPIINGSYQNPNTDINRCLYHLSYNIYNNANQTIVQKNYMNNNNSCGDYNMLNFKTSLPQFSHEKKQNIDNSIFPVYFCFICKLQYIDENLLFMHYNYDNAHKYRMEAIQLILKDKYMKLETYYDNKVTIIKCLKCQIILNELNAAIFHLFEIQHRIEKQNNEGTFNNAALMNNDYMSRNIFICPICKVHVGHDYMMVLHLESNSHKDKVKEYYANINCGSFEKIIFFCPPCNCNFFNDKILLNHFFTSHSFKNTIPTNNGLFPAPDVNAYLGTNLYNGSIYSGAHQQLQQYYNIKYNSNFNSTSSNDMNHALHNLVNLNLNKNQQSLLVNKQRQTFNQDKENNAPTASTIRIKNLISFSPRYVKLCVESGEENIFKINPEKLKVLQLGISLTFPFESNRGCIPCGHEISNDPQRIYEHLRSEQHEKNLQEMEENDEYFENYRDQFSDLELGKQYMHEESDELVKCLVCKVLMDNKTKSIRKHINLEPHISNYQSWKKSADEIFKLFNKIFKSLWYYIEKFFCNLCCVQFEFEVYYARHLETPTHLKEVEKRLVKGQSLQFDFCILCSCYWFARANYHATHCEKNSHKYILKSRDFTVPEMPDVVKTLLISVDETIDKLLRESNEATISNKEAEKNILESVEMVAKSKYPHAKAYLFGSRISYLGSEDSDLDIFLDCEDQYKTINCAENCENQLTIVQECFHKYQDIWVIQEVILRTRVPIIKLKHRLTNLNCDISFINGLSVEKSKILGYFTNSYSPCRKLILYLKKWNNFCRLSGTKGINNFAISWLVIFYLQVEEILPSVQHLIKLENCSNIIAGWETGVSNFIPTKETDFSIKDLLKGFFSYYANFDYISDVACPFLGKTMKKNHFSDIDSLPEEMNIYKIQIKKEKVEFFRLDSPMCIQEPIDLSQNITKAVTKLSLRMFKQYCSESAARLQNSCTEIKNEEVLL